MSRPAEFTWLGRTWKLAMAKDNDFSWRYKSGTLYVNVNSYDNGEWSVSLRCRRVHPDDYVASWTGWVGTEHNHHFSVCQYPDGRFDASCVIDNDVFGNDGYGASPEAVLDEAHAAATAHYRAVLDMLAKTAKKGNQ